MTWCTASADNRRPLHSARSSTFSAKGTDTGSMSCGAIHPTTPCPASSASSTGRPPAPAMTRAASTASPTSSEASEGPTATVAANPNAPSTTTRTPTPSWVSSAAPSSRPSRRCTCWERIRSTRTSALVQPSRSDSPRTASRTAVSRSGSRGSAVAPTRRIVGDSVDVDPGPTAPVPGRGGACRGPWVLHSRSDHTTAQAPRGRSADPSAPPISVSP